MNNINKYVLSLHGERVNSNHAGSKAVFDVEDFLDEIDYKKLFIVDDNSNKYIKLIHILYKWNKYKYLFKDNSIVVLNHPITYGKTKETIESVYIDKLKEKKSVNLVAVIHDLYSIRFHNGKDDYDENVRKEITELNKFDYVIAHNSVMSRWLKDNGLKSKTIDLDVFDYKSDEIEEKHNIESNTKTVAFAGNLDKNKSRFIYDMNKLQIKGLKFNLYGPNYSHENYQCGNVEYKGICTPEQLTSVLNESFGLIWDGESLDTCTGIIGEYTKYNNPHKLSLYIASGIPVIVWKQAAISKFVEMHNIGISVESLNDLQYKIDALGEEDYSDMARNINDLRHKVSKGYFIKRAMKKIEEDIKNNKEV
ncbi:hypothetical protein CHL78_009275 [Romboutsia weinsteinii]|uniref:Beta-1,6-galactofuranosyltransferase n=1 Tax=Romboutsia weinsteinii TaxID=2020949 RepID=A0A371J407_9FIRM|nr:hypothetical protein [Romboutsia weinsteinii]RDY27397.1 hypothetical protein CHL78_009275 [Romboutsia weinsteinii]